MLQYTRLAIDPAMSGVVAPELRTDQLGRVWMAATTTDGTGPADIQLCLVQGDTCVYVGKVNSEPMNPWPILPLAGLPPGLRTGAAIDFAVNVRTTEPLLPTELRFAYHVGPATPGTAIRMHVSTCSFAVGSTGVTCTHVPACGTDDDQIPTVQPSIALTDKSLGGNGSAVTWSLTYLMPSTRTSPIAFSYMDVRRLVMHGTAASPSAIVSVSPDRPQGVCPAKYLAGGWYWGDYIAHAGFKDPVTGTWMHGVLWSTDNERGCLSANNTWQGRHLHVGFTTWTVP